jgi:7,8-dihydroneopterin aldolase/epimerase/oxygenase
MSDCVFVKGLVLHAYYGVMQHEAKVGQTFRLDLALAMAARGADGDQRRG